MPLNTMTSLQEIIARLQEALPLIVGEQQSLPPGPLTIQEVEERHARRKQVDELIHRAYALLRALPYGAQWPQLPKPEWMAWAQALLAQPTSLILEIDTSGLQEGAEVLRLLLLRAEEGTEEGIVVFDQVIRPTQPLAQMQDALAYNGLTEEELIAAPPWEQVWPAFWQQAHGKLLVSFNWDWDFQQLAAACRRRGQGVPALLGLDLQKPARAFFSYAGSLMDLCRHLGESLPDPATALARARGQLALLHAMAEGRLGPRSSPRTAEPPEPGAAAPPAAGDAFEDLDDRDDSQPF